MKIYRFNIEDIAQIPEVSMIRGVVKISLSNEDFERTGNTLEVLVRIKTSTSDTLQQIETNLLRAAATTCQQILPLLQSESPENLRKRIEPL